MMLNLSASGTCQSISGSTVTDSGDMIFNSKTCLVIYMCRHTFCRTNDDTHTHKFYTESVLSL
jgi:hypothetical protein